MRSYQLDWLHDSGTERISLKSRQIGWSDCIALEMVLVSSGLIRLLNRYFRDLGIDWKVLPHNCNVVSKRDTDAKDVIAKAKNWVVRLRTITALRPWLEQPAEGGWSAGSIAFAKSGFRILSETQNPDAARSKTGHLYLDEFAFYRYEAQIWTGALPSIESLPGLRVSIISTPNGTANQYHKVYTNDQKMYGDYSRHKVDLKDAIAAGYPADFDKVKSKKTPDDFAQENMCDFLGASNDYFSLDLLNQSFDERAAGQENVLWFGVDAASTVDTTAVVLIRKQGETYWMGDSYILPRTPYETNEGQNFRLGQDVIVDALIRHLEPTFTKVDVTGDKARQVEGMGSLYNVLGDMRPDTKLLPQTITKEFKDRWVAQVKLGLQSGRLKFEAGRKDYVYTPRNEGEFRGAIKYDRRINREMMPLFMEVSWEATGFDFLRSDFQKVHRKWLGPNKTTFDTHRDATGHGDAFWAALIGFSGAAAAHVYKTNVQQVASEQDAYVEPTYLDYF